MAQSQKSSTNGPVENETADKTTHHKEKWAREGAFAHLDEMRQLIREMKEQLHALQIEMDEDKRRIRIEMDLDKRIRQAIQTSFLPRQLDEIGARKRNGDEIEVEEGEEGKKRRKV